MLSLRDVEIIFFCFARKNVKIALIGNGGVLTEMSLLFLGSEENKKVGEIKY